VASGNQLEQALHRIKALKDAGKQSVCDTALRFITYSVDVDVLFSIALGTYDFKLVLMVAEKSQKDPKEYLPILNKYKAMPEDYMKYSIDKRLKRFESALSHIAKCPDQFEECVELVVEHKLYKQALQLFPVGSDNYKCICQSYASYMESKRYYLEASFLAQRAGQANHAVKLAETAGAWQRAGSLARAAGWRAEQLTDLWRSMATRLEEQNKGIESATIWREWLQDAEESIAVLARCGCWEESIRHCREQNRPDLVETHVRPALEQRMNILASSIQHKKDFISVKTTRLELVCENRNKAQNDEDLGLEEDRNMEDADLFSETTSVGGGTGSVSTSKSKSSLATRQSNRSKSSKNRRKHERKVYSSREGSTHEDLGLIADLHEALTGVPGLLTEVSQVVRSLLELEQQQGLPELQNEADQLLQLCEQAKPRIWPVDTGISEGSGQDRFGPQATVQDIIRGTEMHQGQKYRPHMQLLEPHLRFAPRFHIDPYWKLQIL